MRFATKFCHAVGVLTAAAGLSLVLATPALADGGGGGGGGPGTDRATCPRGEVYDARVNGCVKQGSSLLPDKALADYAYALAKAWRYDEAIEILNQMQNPNTAEALNYRGYATRKMGRVDEGIGYYKRAIALDPRYAQVREYLGEAYVIKHDLLRARAQLRVIKAICGTGCDEYKHLAGAIAGDWNS